jgi:hypothetical protein
MSAPDDIEAATTEGRDGRKETPSVSAGVFERARQLRPASAPRPTDRTKMRRCTGHVQKAVRRAFYASFGQPLTTVDILRRAYPRVKPPYPPWRYGNVHRAAAKFAVVVRRGRTRQGLIWAPNPELSDKISPKND